MRRRAAQAEPHPRAVLTAARSNASAMARRGLVREGARDPGETHAVRSRSGGGCAAGIRRRRRRGVGATERQIPSSPHPPEISLPRGPTRWTPASDVERPRVSRAPPGGHPDGVCLLTRRADLQRFTRFPPRRPRARRCVPVSLARSAPKRRGIAPGWKKKIAARATPHRRGTPRSRASSSALLSRDLLTRWTMLQHVRDASIPLHAAQGA